MSKKPGGSHGAGHVDESWLIPYSDLMTLLLALFIVLFSTSSVDSEKYEAMAEAFYHELGGTIPLVEGGVGPGHAQLPPNVVIVRPSASPDATPGEEPPVDLTEAEIQMQGLFDSISNYIDTYALSNEMQLRLNGEFMLLTLTSDVWFDSGSADISDDQKEIARKLAALITANLKAELPLNIIITGHTDNVPIRFSRYGSNWYLSASRAINFMEAMLEESTMDPRMFSARGYGEYEPIDTNDTDEGRRRNRRVEVLMSFNSEIKQDYSDVMDEDPLEGETPYAAPDAAANSAPDDGALDGEHVTDFTTTPEPEATAEPSDD